MMDGLPTREGQYCTAPMCLLYVNANKQLVPIAIQLKQEEGEDNPVFLPSDHLDACENLLPKCSCTGWLNNFYETYFMLVETEIIAP